MSAGHRTAFVTFELRETTQDPAYGTVIEGDWIKHCDAWAEVQDVLPSRAENIDDNISFLRRPARIRIAEFDGIGVTTAMRVKVASDSVRPERILRIISGPAFVQKTRELEFMAEELSTAGDEV